MADAISEQFLHIKGFAILGLAGTFCTRTREFSLIFSALQLTVCSVLLTAQFAVSSVFNPAACLPFWQSSEEKQEKPLSGEEEASHLPLWVVHSVAMALLLSQVVAPFLAIQPPPLRT